MGAGTMEKRKRPADVDSPDSHSSCASQSSGAGSTLYSSDSVGSASSAGQFTTRRKEKTNMWPSSKPKLADFKEKIRTTLFAPTLNTRVRIVCEDYEISTFPLTPCKDCARLYANSGLVQVNLNITTYNLLHTDPHLHQLIAAVKEGLMKGLSNGQSRDILKELIFVIRSCGLCPTHNLTTTVHSPSTPNESGGIRVKVGVLETGAAVPVNMDIVGSPDICVTSVVEPHLFIAMGESKLVRERKWREMDRKGERGGEQRGERGGEQRGHSSSMIGQLFWYLVAAQLKRYVGVRHTDTPVTPILGLYFENFNLQLAVCDLYRTGNKEYVLKLYKDPHPRPLHAGIVNMVEVLHRFMASPAVTPTRVE